MMQVDFSEFNKRFHGGIKYLDSKSNLISSTLGAWILLVQTAGPQISKLDSKDRSELESWLGTDVESAYSFLKDLLLDMPEAIRLALATWTDKNFASQPTVQDWLNNFLPEITHAGSIPSKDELDAWANDKTLSIIPKFPIDEQDLSSAFLIIANAIATKIEWENSFDEAPNTTEFWKSEKLLHQKQDRNVYFTQDEEGNLYGVVKNRDATGVEVYAVIAEDPALDPQQVIHFAENLDAESIWSKRPDDLPEQSRIHSSKTFLGLDDTYEAFLPAWSAESSHDLSDLNLPVNEALSAVLAGTFEDGDHEVKAIQVAKAEYNKKGFEAAAISALFAFASSAMPPQPTLHRHYTLTFAHPYAVVATYQKRERGYRLIENPWNNLPLFTAWVKEAAEVSDKEFKA